MAMIRLLASPTMALARAAGIVHSFWTQHMTVRRSTPRSVAKCVFQRRPYSSSPKVFS